MVTKNTTFSDVLKSIGFALLTDSWDMRRQMLSREGSAGGKTLHNDDVNRCLQSAETKELGYL